LSARAPAPGLGTLTAAAAISREHGAPSVSPVGHALQAAAARHCFSFSRDLEFATEPELAKRMGCGRHLWLRAAVKELIDNALDDAEEHGLASEITIEIDGDQLIVDLICPPTQSQPETQKD
jgi:hypothetical protein